MGDRGFDWRVFVRSWQAVVAVWLAYAVVRLAIQPLLGWEPVGPDDWTRLLEVRAWLDGQSWWDVTQYRMNPPEGFSMHWSRLVDLPLAALMLVFGETAAMALVPLLWLVPALFALRSIMLRLDFAPLAFAFGLVLLPFFPLLPGVFAPMAIDHHTPQATLALVCGALLIRDSRWSALACGVLAGAWVVISLEGLPLVAVIAGLYGLRYWFGERMLLPWYLAALTLASGGLSMATRAFEPGYCDVLLPGHVMVFAAAAVFSALMPWLPLQDRVQGRVIALIAMALACLQFATNLLGPCAANPMQQLDPLLQTYWHGYITEGLPVWQQPVSVALMLVWTIAIVCLGWWRAHCTGKFHQGRALPCTLLFLYALATGGYSLLVMREGVAAQLLAIPFAALLLAEWLPRARAIGSAGLRIVATLAVLGFATPMFASALAKPLDRHFPMATMRPDVVALIERGHCDYSRLDALEPGLVLAPLDAGPRILGLTGHTIVAASYHRNQRPMRDVVATFTGPVDEARATAGAYEVEYVVACGSAADVALYRTASDGNFANALLSGELPDWLERDEQASHGSLRVYRVVR